MSDSTVDLRSDVVTTPTEAMWEAMREAPLGWAVTGEDRSVRALESTAAELTGKEAALFIPTGTMANLVALLAHTSAGERIILEASSHIFRAEESSYASMCGLEAQAIPGSHGYMEPEAVLQAIHDPNRSQSRGAALICLEDTHNSAGGTVLDRSQLASVASVAHAHRIPVHLDGARLFNASVALGVTARDLVAEVDTIALSLNKGLSAPGGAVLCGPAAFIERSRYQLRRLGGHSVHKAGIFAAAGLVALRTMIPRLGEDHRRARLLGEALVGLPGVYIDLARLRTNIVMATLDAEAASADLLVERLEQRRIRARVYGDQRVRFVTHRHITDADIARAATEIRKIMMGLEAVG